MHGLFYFRLTKHSIEIRNAHAQSNSRSNNKLRFQFRIYIWVPYNAEFATRTTHTHTHNAKLMQTRSPRRCFQLHIEAHTLYWCILCIQNEGSTVRILIGNDKRKNTCTKKKPTQITTLTRFTSSIRLTMQWRLTSHDTNIYIYFYLFVHYI